jgi:plasmid stabilization system protein ParE
MKIVVSRAAAADLERLHAFLADKNPTAAQQAVLALVAAVESLDVFPERGRPTGIRDIRELIVSFGRSAYVRRYADSAAADEAMVLRIWHAREAREE